jgi:hypothetical protein
MGLINLLRKLSVYVQRPPLLLSKLYAQCLRQRTVRLATSSCLLGNKQSLERTLVDKTAEIVV